MINIGDARKPRYYEGVVQPFYRKQSPTKTVTLYLPCLDVWSAPDSRYYVTRHKNSLAMEDNPFMKGVIEGVVGINPNIFSLIEKVFVEVVAHYVYNKSVVDRYNFNINRVAFRVYRCLYPPRSTKEALATYSDLDTYWKPIQQLTRKIKTNHFPFYFDLNDGPDSLWMHDFADPSSKQPHNGIVWECFAYVRLQPSTESDPNDTARLRIRKLTFIPEEFRMRLPIPMKFQDRQFATCTCKADNGVITVAARLDKYTYCQNEEIKVYIKIHNSSERVIQRVRVAAEQVTTYETYENHDIVTKVDSYLLNDEVKDLPILPHNEDWKVMLVLKPSVRRSENKETSIEPPERNASQLPIDCFLSSTSFPFAEMEKLITREIDRFDPINVSYSIDENDGFQKKFTHPTHYKRPSDVPRNPIEGMINPVNVAYRVTVKVECPIPTQTCIRYEAPELDLDFYLINCEPSPAKYIPVSCKEMINTECIN